MARKMYNGLDLQSQKIVTMADPSSAQDAATKAYVDNRSPGGRGLLVRIDSASSTGSISTETVALTTASATYIDGRAYEIKVGYTLTNSTSAFIATRIRYTNVSGTIVVTWGQVITAGGGTGDSRTLSQYVKVTGGSNVSKVICITAEASTGTTVMSGAPARFLEVYDVGLASAYSNAFVIS